jgi:hypothetical protein
MMGYLTCIKDLSVPSNDDKSSIATVNMLDLKIQDAYNKVEQIPQHLSISNTLIDGKRIWQLVTDGVESILYCSINNSSMQPVSVIKGSDGNDCLVIFNEFLASYHYCDSDGKYHQISNVLLGQLSVYNSIVQGVDIDISGYHTRSYPDDTIIGFVITHPIAPHLMPPVVQNVLNSTYGSNNKRDLWNVLISKKST